MRLNEPVWDDVREILPVAVTVGVCEPLLLLVAGGVLVIEGDLLIDGVCDGVWVGLHNAVVTWTDTVVDQPLPPVEAWNWNCISWLSVA